MRNKIKIFKIRRNLEEKKYDIDTCRKLRFTLSKLMYPRANPSQSISLTTSSVGNGVKVKLTLAWPRAGITWMKKCEQWWLISRVYFLSAALSDTCSNRFMHEFSLLSSLNNAIYTIVSLLGKGTKPQQHMYHDNDLFGGTLIRSHEV